MSRRSLGLFIGLAHSAVWSRPHAYTNDLWPQGPVHSGAKDWKKTVKGGKKTHKDGEKTLRTETKPVKDGKKTIKDGKKTRPG